MNKQCTHVRMPILGPVVALMLRSKVMFLNDSCPDGWKIEWGTEFIHCQRSPLLKVFSKVYSTDYTKNKMCSEIT